MGVDLQRLGRIVTILWLAETDNKFENIAHTNKYTSIVY